MSESFNDAAKTVMAHKIAGAVDEYLTPFIVSIIRQAKAEALREAQAIFEKSARDGSRAWDPAMVSCALGARAAKFEQEDSNG